MFTNDIHTFYQYRRAYVEPSFVMPIDYLHQKLVKKYVEEQGHKFDNHIAWRDESGLAFQYSDHELYIGKTLVVKSW